MPIRHMLQFYQTSGDDSSRRIRIFIMAHSLQDIADAVVRRAQRVGSVTPSDLRAELKLAGFPPTQWKEIAGLAKTSLHYRQGRYYPLGGQRIRLEQEHAQRRAIEKVIRKLIRLHKAQVKNQERRGQTRVDYIQPVQVQTDDGKTFTLLSRDLSTTGIRLLGTRQLLGQKVHVFLPQGDGEAPSKLQVRVLWTCAVGDDLFENGGMFIHVGEETK